MQKGHCVTLTAGVTARDFNHKVHTMSWPMHDCTGLFECEQLRCFKVKRSVINTHSDYRECVITAK